MTALKKGVMSWMINVGIAALGVFSVALGQQIQSGAGIGIAFKVAIEATFTSLPLLVVAFLKGGQQGVARSKSTGGEDPAKKK